MARIQSAEELGAYCLRRLGAPVNDIAIDQSQIDDCIDDALQYYIEYHYDGSTETYLRYQITDADVVRGYLCIPDEVVELIRIYDPSLSSTGSGEEFERLNFQLANTDMSPFLKNTGHGVASYHLAFEQIATLRRYFNPDRSSFDFNKNSKRLKTSGRLVAGNFIYLHCYVALEPEEDIDIFNDHWIKEYCTQLIKKDYGSILKLFDNVQLAGGIQVDGQRWYDEATAEIEKMREEFQRRYTLPPKFFMG